MVRYSRLPFRQLVREFGAELVYTPMLISDSFIQSKSARDADFRSNSTDGPLIVQFASNKPETFGEVAQVILRVVPSDKKSELKLLIRDF